MGRQYGVEPGTNAFFGWLKSHQPFHWFVQFNAIMQSGGFDVIIGNPPYVETHKVVEYKARGYSTENTGNIYPLCVERCAGLLAEDGYFGQILPLSGFSTERMKPYQELVWRRYSHLTISFYSGDAHPAVLFDGVKYRLCILLGHAKPQQPRSVWLSDYTRWYAAERQALFSAKLQFHKSRLESGFLRFAKAGSPLASQALLKMLARKPVLGAFLRRHGPGHINYHRSPVFWIRSMDFEPFFRSPFKDRSTDHLKDLYFQSPDIARRAGAVLNSTCFYFWFTTQGNCRNVAGPDIEAYPSGELDEPICQPLEEVFAQLMGDLRRNSRRRVYVYERSGEVEYDEFYPDRSKQIIDQIDRALARHYAFTEEEMDFMVNYDIKYRIGRNAEDTEEE